MQALAGRKVLLGISGGIAAYKAAILARRLIAEGAEVRVVMTSGACAFVAPLTFQALTGKPVHTDLLDASAEAAMGHIELARWADHVLVAPASASVMARLAHGFADDLLTTLCLATDAPLYLAPAMNRLMWAHPATLANRELLAARGTVFFGPAAGSQACGETGDGRMLEPDDIVAALVAVLVERLASGTDTPAASGADTDSTLDLDDPLVGTRLLLTAGPTREAIDPVRYLSNHSSGKMGFALAEAAARRGASVVLVAGPVTLPTPAGVERIDVESALDMHAAVMARVPQADVFVGVAAVADYRLASVAGQKIKKSGNAKSGDAASGDGLRLDLVPNPDILREVAALEGGPLCIGFAAETERLEAHARAKLRDKGLAMIAANRVADPDAPVFGADSNALELYWGEAGHRTIARAPKAEVATRLLDAIGERLLEDPSRRLPDDSRAP